jgi:hypothetical protein
MMRSKKAFTRIGKKLEKEYEKLGFRYSKKYRYLRKRTKKFDYFIFFSHFFDYIPDTYIELCVTLCINDRPLLKNNIYAHSELFSMNLWDMGNHYNIANEALINDTFTDLKTKIAEYLIPQIRKLEEGNR